eukprot:1718302-Prorocentrum_lima.AAC.1
MAHHERLHPPHSVVPARQPNNRGHNSTPAVYRTQRPWPRWHLLRPSSCDPHDPYLAISVLHPMASRLPPSRRVESYPS